MANGTTDDCERFRTLIEFYNEQIQMALDELAQLQQAEPPIRTDPLQREIRMLVLQRRGASDALRRCLAGLPFPPSEIVQFLRATATILTDRSAGPSVVPNVVLKITFNVPRTGVSLEKFATGFMGATANFGDGTGTFDPTTGSMTLQTQLMVTHPFITASSATLALTTGSATPVGPFAPTGAPLNPNTPQLSGTIALVSAFQLVGGTFGGTAVSLMFSGVLSA